MASPEQPSAERIAECAEVVAEQLLIGSLEPQDVPLPTRSIDSSWLDTIERDIFADAVATNEIERAHIRREWGAWRLVRRLAEDDATSVRWLCEHVVVGPTPLNARLRRLMEALRSHVPIMPAHASRTLH